MAPPRASAIYKKRDGTLAVSKDLQSVIWTPTSPPGSKPGLLVSISSITNLQQTPASAAKVMLKIYAQAPEATAIETHIFAFTSVNQARAEADAIKDTLTKSIQASKASTAIPSAGGFSAALAMASASSSKSGRSGDDSTWLSDESLKLNAELQQSLLKASPTLSKTFMEATRTKPESISGSQFNAQFWGPRLNLLRAHAIERSQSKGAYNVLSTIKPKTDAKLSITMEQIQLIFSQHPLVRRIYDENVPKLSEESFWSRFFQSRLFKSLKGEKIDSALDPPDSILDKYLFQNNDTLRNGSLTSHIPLIIDLAGNEENNSQRQGNAPDFTMRPAGSDRVPILRVLNSLSEKIMSHVTPNDVNPSEPIGMDEETFNALALRDLRGDAEENRLILNIKDQSRFFSSEKENAVSADLRRYSKQDPHEVLRNLLTDLSIASEKDLGSSVGFDEESSDSESEDASKQMTHMGSKSSLRKASAQIFEAIAEQRSQDEDPTKSSSLSTDASTTCDLSRAVFDRICLTHATTMEFLHHFWDAFLSGNVSRAEEVAKLVETLDRAMDRIEAVASSAEVERQLELDKMKDSIRDHYARTHRKIAFDSDAIKGGAKVVRQLMAPTVEAIKVATGKYRKALLEQDVG